MGSKDSRKVVPNQPRRPFKKSDLEAVLKAATKPLKQEQGEKESEGTSESHPADDSI